jgi:hypothetical protein
MASEKRRYVSGLRKCYEDEIEGTIRQMKIEGGTVDDCIAELNLLAGFVRSWGGRPVRCMAHVADGYWAARSGNSELEKSLQLNLKNDSAAARLKKLHCLRKDN